MKINWQIKRLGEVCDFEGGSQPPKVNFIHEPRKGYVRFLQIRDFGSDKYITYIPNSNKNRHCTEEDILLGRYGASVGKILVNKKGAYNVAVMKTIPNFEFLDKKYFYFYLISDEFQKRLSKVAARSAQAGFSKDDIYDFPIIIPPLPEQHRIVKILDETFEKIEKAKENIKKNLRNATELFESYLQSVFVNPGKDWEEKRLGDVYDVRDGTHDSPKYQKNGYALITSKNLKRDELDYQKIKYISEKDYKKINERSKVHKGDILFAMIGTIGNPVVIKTEPDFAIKNVALFKVPKNQNSYFLKYFLDSKFVIDKMISEAKGTTQKFVGLGCLRDFKIKFPILNKQISIVAKLDKLSAETKKLESVYKQKLTDLEELKKSILKKAFNGEL
jgi:type I restriction enzyme S subunit